MPFKKRRGKYKIPGMATENPISMEHVDPDLSPEEQGYIRHYLGYADALLRSAEQNVAPDPLEELTEAQRGQGSQDPGKEDSSHQAA